MAWPATATLLGILLATHAAAVAPPGLPGTAAMPDEALSLPDRLVQVDAVQAAWSIDHGLSLAAGKGVATPSAQPKSVCALGDADGDGYDDILVRYAPGQTDGHHKFEALAGPDFARSLWRAEPRDGRLMACGADVTGDAVVDPIVVTAPEATDEPVPSTPATASEATTSTSIPLDGAAGGELAQIEVDSSTSAAGVAPATAGSEQGGQVVPAGEGALLVIGSSETGASASSPQPASASESQATIQVVDEGGSVLGTIETPAGADALAAAPVPTGEGGLPGIVVLSETQAVPADQAPAGVPTVTLYEGDGTEQWSSPQDPTAGVPVVLPDAGDVDGDGVTDLIYATIPPEVGTVPSGGFEVLSGADGSSLLGSGDAQDGLVTALPLGDVSGDGADEILVVEQPAEGGGITLSAEGGDGGVLWTVGIDAEAAPANTVTDPASGNTVGFSDLTGDGVPDVLVTAPSEDGTSVEVIDGATGDVVWSGDFEGADSVTAVPGAPGEGEDLIVVDVDGGLTVVGVDGGTGETNWETGGDGATTQEASVTPAGDVDGDGVEDVLVTIGSPGPDGKPDPDQPGSSYIVSGDTGEPVWSGSNGPEGDDDGVIELSSAGGDGDDDGTDGGSALGVPGFFLAGLLMLAVLLAVIVALRRKGE